MSMVHHVSRLLRQGGLRPVSPEASRMREGIRVSTVSPTSSHISVDIDMPGQRARIADAVRAILTYGPYVYQEKISDPDAYQGCHFFYVDGPARPKDQRTTPPPPHWDDYLRAAQYKRLYLHQHPGVTITVLRGRNTTIRHADLTPPQMHDSGHITVDPDGLCRLTPLGQTALTYLTLDHHP